MVDMIDTYMCIVFSHNKMSKTEIQGTIRHDLLSRGYLRVDYTCNSLRRKSMIIKPQNFRVHKMI